ncbi:transposable element Tcb2 transposase [Trichonephila clavipes]|nr:transposable element Tcb2 transposase [Trichonephila clavipes]
MSLESFVAVKQTMKFVDRLNIFADRPYPHITSVYSTGSGIVQLDKVPCRKAQTILECFKEHNDEFQLISGPPKLPDLNPREHVWDFVGNFKHFNIGISRLFVTVA